MRAIHLPGVPDGEAPPYSFPDKPPPPSVLDYSTSFPGPKPLTSPKTHAYLISVTATALTRGELTWDEILDPSRFHPHGSAIPGHDLVGTVHTVYAADSTTSLPKFKAGDKVWGLIDFDRDGAAATYTLAYENELALLPEAPEGVDQEKWELPLATLPLSALTAYQSLFDHGNIPKSLLNSTSTPSNTTSDENSTRRSILILGPTGSVGLPTLYLSLAASLPTTVLTSSHHLPFLNSLGANTTAPFNIISRDDGTYKDLPSAFTQQSFPAVDLIIDAVGGTTLQSLLTSPSLTNVIAPGGKVVTLVAPIDSLPPSVSSAITENCSRCKVEVEFFIVKPNGEQMDELGKLAHVGKLAGHVDAVFPLDKGREAMEMVEGKKKGVGKVVLKVNGGPDEISEV